MKNIKIGSFLSLTSKRYKGFTLAEILLSLSIIGVVAAIALPSLLGNVHERAFETQKKALYTRFSQALPLLPSLNGYGELYEREKTGGGKELVDTATESFVRDGLSKVMKITNICDSEHLTDCGLPDKIIPISSTNAVQLSNIKTLATFNERFSTHEDSAGTYEQLDTKAAAFETVNGESILVYYNPYCEANLKENTWYRSQPKMCANFVYDLNGKKGPNTIGKDVGFITALYATAPTIVAPIPYSTNIRNVKFTDVFSECKKIDKDAKVPNKDEMTSLFYNMKLLGNVSTGTFWSNTAVDTNNAWRITFSHGGISPDSTDTEYYVRCIKR